MRINGLKSIIKYGKIERNVSLNTLSTIRIGGIADYVIYPSDIEEIYKLLQKVQKEKIPYFILGNGSNVLFSDKGFRGIIIKIGHPFDCIDRDENLFHVESGCTIAKFCKLAQTTGYKGVECLYGIPGTVGGGVRMNCGAFGMEIADHIQGVTYTDGIKIKYLKKEDCGFGYRNSVFKEHPEYIILGVDFLLEKGDSYKIEEKMKDVMNQRVISQDLNHPSCGSVFKRCNKLSVPVSKLIDQMGLKGFSIGGARISEKHAGFLINFHSASSQNVLDLIQYIREMFLEYHGVNLETEIEIVGEK